MKHLYSAVRVTEVPLTKKNRSCKRIEVEKCLSPILKMAVEQKEEVKAQIERKEGKGRR
jgi:hypothetical protein